jgi:preprotein translocase SecE subunit
MFYISNLSALFNQLLIFFKEVRSEFLKVEWPKRDDFIGSTIVTLMFILFFIIFLGAIDFANRFTIYEKIFSYIK